MSPRLSLVHLALPQIAALHCADLLLRAEEAWEPVIFGGLIPMIGALAVGFLLWYAVRQKPEDDDEGDPR